MSANYTPHTWVDGSVGTPLSAARLNELEAGVVAVDNAQAARQPALAPTAVKTSSYTAAVGELVPVDLASANVTVTLPSAPADKTQVAVKVVTPGSSKSLTVATGGSDVFNKTAGPTTLSFSLINQGAILQYRATGAIWYVISEYVPLSGLDGRYVASVSAGDSTITVGGTVSNPTIVVASSALSGKADTTAVIPPSLLTAKGDVIAASASGVPMRIPVGTNGQLLTADSTQAGGVKWSSAGSGVSSVTAADTSITIAGSATTPTVAVGISAARLTPVATKTTAYSAAAGDFVPVDTTSGAVTVTLPAAPADKTQVSVMLVTQGGSNALTVAASGSDKFNIQTTGPSSVSIPTVGTMKCWQYRSSTATWYPAGSDLDQSTLASAFQPLDADLTAIAGLTSTATNFLQAGPGGGWASRSIAQVKVDLSVPDGYMATSGESTVPRTSLISTSALVSGTISLTFFTARKTENITQVRLPTGNTAAAATPTLVRIGIYSEDQSTGDLTLVQNVANDTTLFAAANTEYTKSLAGTWAKVAGTRYAFAVIIVTGAALPTLTGPNMNNSTVQGTILSRSPRLAGAFTGQTDLVSSISNASITYPAPRFFYAEVLP